MQQHRDRRQFKLATVDNPALSATMNPTDLNWRHLRGLGMIAGAGNYRLAAEWLHLSQPALTKGIVKLERQLGTDLVVRTPAGASLSGAGESLADRTARAFELLARGIAAGGGRRRHGRPEFLVTASELRAILAVADAGSFVGAATAVGLSEPALHRAVRELEQVAGSTLVERRGRGIQLTAAGRALARGARLAVREIAAGLSEARGDPGLLGPIRIGAMPFSRSRVLPDAIIAFRNTTPGAEVWVAEGGWRELINPLRDGSLDLLIGALRGEVGPDLIEVPLFEGHLVVIGRHGHPLAGTLPDTATLAQCDWIIATPGTPLRAQWEQLFVGRALPSAPVAAGSIELIRRLLVATDLLTLMSRDQLSVELDAGLLTVIGEPVPSSIRQIGITTRAGWRPTVVQQRLLDTLVEAARQTSGEVIAARA